MCLLLRLIPAVLLIFSACASTPRIDAQRVLSPGDPRIGEYLSSWNGFRTSSYWIEGPTGLIVVDTQFLTSAAEQMIDWAERSTGKKVVLAIVLHPNPDKFNGTAVFQKRGIRVVTSAQVLERIPTVHKLRMGWFYERFKPDYPSAEPRPESFGSQTTELEAGGIRVKAHVLGAGCSDAHVVVEFEGHVFVGDLVTRGFHAWLELGLLEEWLKRLEEIEALEPMHVHTGRGGSGDEDLLERQKFYLQTVLQIIRAEKPRKGSVPTAEALMRIENKILQRFPGFDYPVFIQNGLLPAWQKLAR